MEKCLIGQVGLRTCCNISWH